MARQPHAFAKRDEELEKASVRQSLNVAGVVILTLFALVGLCLGIVLTLE